MFVLIEPTSAINLFFSLCPSQKLTCLNTIANYKYFPRKRDIIIRIKHRISDLRLLLTLMEFLSKLYVSINARDPVVYQSKSNWMIKMRKVVPKAII